MWVLIECWDEINKRTLNVIYPEDDLRPHQIEGSGCWCQPYFEDDKTLLIHRSMDEREYYEDGRKKPS